MKIKDFALRGLALYGNTLYNVASALRAGNLRKMAERAPRSYIIPAEKIRTDTARKIAPSLQHVIKEVSGRTLPRHEVIRTISEGIETGLSRSTGRGSSSTICGYPSCSASWGCRLKCKRDSAGRRPSIT